jgi:hypothetical protein
MKYIELFEGTEPQLPGAPSGIQIMTPQQFVAKSQSGQEPTPDEEVEESAKTNKFEFGKNFIIYAEIPNEKNGPFIPQKLEFKYGKDEAHAEEIFKQLLNHGGVRHKNVVAKEISIDEATKLPASTRELKGQELTDYLDRIRGTTDIDKKTGQPKVDKKGKEKYISGKTKLDKYRMPYIHRSAVLGFYSPEGKKYDIDKLKDAMKQRPAKLLKQNEKMKHSNGELEQFFNIGFAALVGSAVDETTNEIIIVNTCPGAGSCKVDCFAMKGGKIQYDGPWLSDARILTFLLNDPEGFKAQLNAEIAKEAKAGATYKKGPYSVSIRWHDAGDFFSPEYLGLAFDIARANPTVKFYAYTKMASAALAQKPANFIINWSEGAHTSQEKQIKAADPNLERTKNSRIVPDKLFQDLLVKDEKGNLIKGSEGQWQVQPDKLKELKMRLGQAYGISPNSILSYDEYTSKPKTGGMKYNVIVAPGEGDISANDPNVLSTLLLRH